MTRSGGPTDGRATADLPAYVEPADTRNWARVIRAYHHDTPMVTAFAAVWVGVTVVLVVAALLPATAEWSGTASVALALAALTAGVFEAVGALLRRKRPDLGTVRLPTPIVWGLSGARRRQRVVPLVAANAMTMGFVVVVALLGRVGRSPEFVGFAVGVAGGLSLNAARGATRLRRVERTTGDWVVAGLLGGRWRLYTSHAADGLVVAGTPWRVTLPAPLAECDLAAFDPFRRWAVLMTTDRVDEAALEVSRFAAAEPAWAAWAAVSLVAQGRLDEAENCVQRAVDDGYRGAIDPAVVKVLRPLHDTAAWWELLKQTRGGKGARPVPS
jgi:hypothetical protein